MSEHDEVQPAEEQAIEQQAPKHDKPTDHEVAAIRDVYDELVRRAKNFSGTIPPWFPTRRQFLKMWREELDYEDD